MSRGHDSGWDFPAEMRPLKAWLVGLTSVWLGPGLLMLGFMLLPPKEHLGTLAAAADDMAVGGAGAAGAMGAVRAAGVAEAQEAIGTNLGGRMSVQPWDWERFE